MKKTVKKLELSKETIRSLAGVELRKVTGGTDLSWRSCGCPHTYTCESGDPVDTN